MQLLLCFSCKCVHRGCTLAVNIVNGNFSQLTASRDISLQMWWHEGGTALGKQELFSVKSNGYVYC